MEIKVLGTGCAKCSALLKTVEQVVEELELEAKVIKVDDILKIIEYKILGLPALVVDEKVLSAGVPLSKEEVKKYLTQNR